MPIQANQPAPAFALPDENGKIRTLEEFRGKPVVLYFYPKDDTPGCTTEACNFRDDYHIYQENGVVILGVSPDDAKSHTKFKTKFNLPFTLLADDGHKVCDAYQVWGLKKFVGREYMGVLRTTFVIGSDGNILKVFENVKPDGHSAQVLAAIKQAA
ncbi:MAG TPA: thioredoxin-dependent thiol peroxidase [Anaerolineaceae bacterium]